MSLYKNLGPISFNAETQLAELFTTDKYWLIQLKQYFNQNHGNSDKELQQNKNINPLIFLEKQVDRLNSCLSLKAICVYSQHGKMPSLLMNKNNISKCDLQSDKSIQNLCLVCHALLNSYYNINSFIIKIEKQLFFMCNLTNQMFYLNMQYSLNQKEQSYQTSNINTIISFLEQIFCINSRISNKLLLKKLKKCTKLKQIKQQLDYFQNVYEIGGKKIKQQIKTNQKKDLNIFRESSLTKNHRKYRRRSQQIYLTEQATQISKNHTNPNEKRISHSLHNKQESCSFFSNRNKNSKAFHSSYTDFKHATGTVRSKGLFSTSRSKDKKYKLALNSNNKLKNLNKMSNTNQQKNRNSLLKVKDAPKKQEKKQQMILKQQLTKNLQQWKQKRLRYNNNWFNDQKSHKKQQRQNTKQIKRKHKGQSINYINLSGQELPPKQFENKIRNTLNKPFQSSKMISAESQIQISKNLTSNPDEQETLRNYIQKENNLKKSKKQSIKKKEALTITQTQVIKHKLNKRQKQKQKQKTKRKITNPSQIIQQNVLKIAKEAIQKINYIGQCVTKTPNYLSNLNNGEKYLWQLPAFLLYKQFYIRRLQIQQNLKAERLSLKIDKGQIIKIINQLQEQNKQTKQSLIKLLKTGLKKLKKYQLDQCAVESAKSTMNLQFPGNSHKNCQIISNFISQIQEMRVQKPDLLSYEIQIIDAYMILKQLHFDIQRRKKIDVEDYKNHQTIKYFQQRFGQICDILNKQLS